MNSLVCVYQVNRGLVPRYGKGKLVSPGDMDALFFHGQWVEYPL